MINNTTLNNPLGVKPKQQQGTGFVNLNKVLGANQGNQLGSAVAGGLNQGAQQVQQGVNQLKTDFNQQADANNLASANNKQAVSDALKNIANNTPANPKDMTPNQPAGTPGQLSSMNVNFGLNPAAQPAAPAIPSLVSDDQVKQFGTFLAGNYAGPTSLDATKSAQVGAKAQEIQDLGQGLNSGADKTKLLQTFAGKGPYTAGESRLDSLLLGQGPQAKQQLAEARNNTRGLTQQLNRGQNDAAQLAQLKQNQAQQFAKETQNALTKAQTDYTTPLQQQADIYKSQQTAKSAALQNLLSNLGTNIDPNEAKALGLAPGNNLNYTYGYKPGADLINTSLTQPTALNVASPQQQAQLLALAKLSGQDAPIFGEQYDPNKAVSVNTDNLQKGIAAKQSAYQTDLKNILAQYQGSSNDLINSQISGLNRKYGLPDNYSPPLAPGGIASNLDMATPTQKDAQQRNRARFL